MTTLEVKFLSRISRKVKNLEASGEALDEIDLDVCYGDSPGSDAYHAELKKRSMYCSMADIGEYLKEKYPDLDFSAWSMQGYLPGSDRIVTVGKKRISIPNKVVKSLEREHIDTATYEVCMRSDTVEVLYDDGWVLDMMPCYLTKAVLRKILDKRLEYSMSLDMDDVISSLESYDGYGHRDIIGFLSDCLSYSKASGYAAWAYVYR